MLLHHLIMSGSAAGVQVQGQNVLLMKSADTVLTGA